MTLAEFLLARIADEEELAVTSIRSGEAPERQFAVPLEEGGVRVTGHSLIVRCEYRRRIVEAYLAAGEGDRQATLHWVLRQLALPYAGHLDYRREWRPEDDAVHA